MQGHNILINFDAEKCCGCGNCINSCPNGALSYSKDTNGFIVPKLDVAKCIDCSICLKRCPYNTSLDKFTPINCYAALNKKDEVLLKSSSGGVFYELARSVLDRRGVVYGASFSKDYKVNHVRIDDIKSLEKIMKSKYVQSFLGNIFQNVKNDLKEKIIVMFSGTPCQIVALKTFLQTDYDNLFLVSVACHGVPSQQLFDDYLRNLEKKGKIQNFSFRSKIKPKNGMNAFISYEQNDKRIIKNWLDDSFYYFFMHSYSGRDSCYGCKFVGDYFYSDITLCDYWGWEKHHISSFNRNDSISGVIVSTRKGNELFDSVKNELIIVETKFDWIVESNKSINIPNTANKNRQAFFETYIKYGYEKVDSVYKRKTFFKRVIFRIKRVARKLIGRR